MIITVILYHFVNDAVSTATGTRRRAGQETINERGIIIMIITVTYIICYLDAVSTATGTRRRAEQETINERGIIIEGVR